MLKDREKRIEQDDIWKKICEDEKKSQWRNEQLLKDFDRVESQMAMLNARAAKLRDMKVIFWHFNMIYQLESAITALQCLWIKLFIIIFFVYL